MRIALIAYGILNAILYASLLPLWEGFDEPFHYGYVQELSQQASFPQLGKTGLSNEIWESLHLAPASHVVKHNLPWATTFEEYFRMSPAERADARMRLERLPHDSSDANGLNYEAQQAPLAYAFLALADRVWASAGLVPRIWRLRLVCGIAAIMSTGGLLFALARRMNLRDQEAEALVFIVFSCQMFYATTAHISNDWLAVPLMVLLFERLIATWDDPRTMNVGLLAAAFVAALLTKAYFLSLVPLALWMTWRLKRAALFALLVAAGSAPWYIRNLRLYRNLSGMQETGGGADWSALAAAFFRVPWLRSAKDVAYASVWTGNNSFGSFSAITVSMLLLGFLVAVVLYGVRWVKEPPPARERIVLGGCVLYGIGLMYSTTVSFWFNHGTVFATAPWYTQPILPVMGVLIFRGLARFPRWRMIITIWLVGWSAYLISATYWAKLIPLYAGYGGGRTTLRALIAWYRDGLPGILNMLDVTALASGKVIFVLAAMGTAAAVTLAIILSLREARS